ncbi:hypothetical protein G9A89_020180 [Geosiphon pyriformis]|nr:hypothetical protein G9A89_020180 [Geosiphon pyriformis]
MAVNNVLVPPILLLTGINVDVSGFSSSSSKILTTKMSSLESKIVVDLVWKIVTCNIRDMNNFAKQADIIHWHKGVNNLISVVTEIKLKDKVCP